LLCELPLRELLKGAGLELSAKSDPPGDSTSEAWWGLKTAEGGPDQFATVIEIERDGPAWQAGITSQDAIVALNRSKVSARTFPDRARP